MKVQPMSAAPQTMQTGPTSAQRDTRAAVVAKIEALRAGTQPEQPVVASQNQVQPEEMAAVAPKTPQVQPDLQEEASASPPAEETPAKPVKTPEQEQLARQYAKLVQQEKAARARAAAKEQELKAKEAALAAREAEFTANSQPKQGYISADQLKQNAIQTLLDNGISWDEVTKQALEYQPMNPQVQAHIQRLEAQLAKLESQAQEGRKSQEQSQQQAYQAAVKQIENDAKKLIATDPTYEMIKATNSTKDVVELITRTFDADGIVLSVEEAAQQVEDYLTEEAEKFTRIEKIKKRLAQSAQSAQPAAKATEATDKLQTQQTMRTLTNANTSQRKLTGRERAILAMQGKL